MVAAAGAGEGVLEPYIAAGHEDGAPRAIAAAGEIARVSVFDEDPRDGPAACVGDGDVDGGFFALLEHVVGDDAGAVEPGEPHVGGEVGDEDEKEEGVGGVGDVGRLEEEGGGEGVDG